MSQKRRWGVREAVPRQNSYHPSLKTGAGVPSVQVKVRCNNLHVCNLIPVGEDGWEEDPQSCWWCGWALGLGEHWRARVSKKTESKDSHWRLTSDYRTHNVTHISLHTHAHTGVLLEAVVECNNTLKNHFLGLAEVQG